jgi:amino-acid N-acetyltransferase
MPLLIRSASREDLVAITHLLASFGLPAAGAADHLTNFLVGEDAGIVVASAGMEIYGSSGLLRSVAVRQSHQGQGVARDMVQALVERARQKGIQRIYLLTETAAPYFQRLGFVSLSRDQVDPAVQASVEFQELCCETAVAMTRYIEPRGVYEEELR